MELFLGLINFLNVDHVIKQFLVLSFDPRATFKANEVLEAVVIVEKATLTTCLYIHIEVIAYCISLKLALVHLERQADFTSFLNSQVWLLVQVRLDPLCLGLE